MPKIRKIPQTINLQTGQSLAQPKRLKAAAYARVSTDHEEQQSSYEAQVDYYTKMIAENPNLEFVAVFADEGITGLSTKKRENFNRMIDEALAGNIDVIYTKSISRFSRNTLDTLDTIRKLKAKNVEVIFEKEGIHTLSGEGEVMLTILSSLAQEESRSISAATTWGHRKRFADGKEMVPFGSFLGYDRGENGELVINSEQAEVVRKIYSLFLDGYSCFSIAKRLTAEDIPTPMGKKEWKNTTVQSILTNVKYKGDALLQKTYTVDFKTKEKAINRGEVQQYYVSEIHDAIIDPETFDAVQAEMERRYKYGIHSGQGVFSSRIRCGDCGSWYGTKVWHSNDRYRRVVYQCNHKYKDKNHPCKTPHLTEDQIKPLFLDAVNQLYEQRDIMLGAVETAIEELQNMDDFDTELIRLSGELEELNQIAEANDRENASKVQDQAEFRKRQQGILDRIDKKQAEYRKVEQQKQHRSAQTGILRDYLKSLKKIGDTVTEFDSLMWTRLTDFMTVYSKDDVRFTFKDGTEIKCRKSIS